MKKLLFLFLFVICSQFSLAQKNGPYEKHYDNGQLKISGQYKDKKRVGEWKEYYESGELYKTYSYTKGESNSDLKSYYKNGILKSEIKKVYERKFKKEYYESGKILSERFLKDGFYKEYFENGKLKIEAIYLEYELSGLWTQYSDTEKKEWEINYLNGYLEGVYKQYYQNGNLKTEGFNKNNKKDGIEKRYNEEGYLEWEGLYVDGVFNKKWKKYDSVGEAIEVIKFKRGELVSSTSDINLNPTIIPDGIYEKVPVYPGCENELGNKAKKKCMSQNISRFIAKKFNTELAGTLGLTGKQKIFVIFKIDKTGNVTGIRAKAPHPELKREAIRVIELLPKMKSGIIRGEPVVVPYSLPIIFQVQDKKTNKKTRDFVRDN